MCLICIEYAKQKMTVAEGYRALVEMSESIGDEHAMEVAEMLEKELWKEWIEKMPQTD